MRITSATFQPGQPIPVECTCDGQDQSPELAWSEIPVDTRSFALICDDPDAPRGTWVHWVIFNLPADAVELVAGVPPVPESPSGARQGMNSSGHIGYGGPCPPPGTPHRYFFRLYSLDVSLNLPPGAKRSDLDRTMAEHILAEAVIMGTYQR